MVVRTGSQAKGVRSVMAANHRRVLMRAAV
jgi:hypothetical protein